MKIHNIKNDSISGELKKRLDEAEKDIENGNYKSFSTVEEFMAEFNKPRPWHYRLKLRVKWFYEDWISPRTWYYRYLRIHRWIKWGFDPYDIWSIDHSLSKWAIPRIKKLKEIKHGIPVCVDFDMELLVAYESERGALVETGEKRSEMLWDFVLDKMVEAFELTIEGDWEKSGGHKEHYKKIQKGMRFFGKYFNNLWD